MQPAAIVVPFDEVFEIRPEVLQVAVLVGINLFHLQSAEEAFTSGIVIRVASTAHAGQDVMLLQDRYILSRGVLYPTVGMMDQARLRLTLGNGLLQGAQGQSRSHAAIQGPAYY